jgi:hypothetical protein
MIELGCTLHPLTRGTPVSFSLFKQVQEKGKREIPEHLTNLFEKSKGELNGQEQTQLSELLCEFGDVLTKSEFDLVKFNTIQHGIDTRTNRPVKQRIRRTPLGFA